MVGMKRYRIKSRQTDTQAGRQTGRNTGETNESRPETVTTNLSHEAAIRASRKYLFLYLNSSAERKINYRESTFQQQQPEKSPYYR